MLLAIPAFAQDWTAVESDTLEHFVKLIRFDTSNPPGNETVAAEYLKKVLDQAGIETKMLIAEPDRANLLARIRGSGAKRPILIMGHTDVVGVQREKWTFEPFSGDRKNGYVFGRGTLDDKDNVVACLMTMLLLKRANVKLDRDVIFLAESGEEGGALAGMQHVVAKHWDEIAPEFVLAEGGGGTLRNGQPFTVTFAAAEKVPRRIKLVAKGVAGHGSVPRPDNAIAHLATAVGKVAAWNPPMKLNDITRTYFERLAGISSPEGRERYNGLFDESKRAAVEAYLAKNELRHNSMLRTSISPTVIKGGFRVNVIPSDAEADLDVRALPDEDMPKFLEMVKGVIGDEAIEIRQQAAGRPAPPASPLDSEMFRVLERTAKKRYPGAAVLPTMLTGATDMSLARMKGVPSYGVGPLIDEKDAESGGGAHGDDEKIAERSLHNFVRFLYEAVVEVAAAKSSR
ncbi:MAG: M20/M25/M40 family metallo-hydrolase [Bryobacteraceae bacterium]|nr:M20/M25/M40 family metallo-hydrolase [Bryobacteraceae bacterium]